MVFARLRLAARNLRSLRETCARCAKLALGGGVLYEPLSPLQCRGACKRAAMAVRLSASIFARRMSFRASPAGVIGALIALAGLALGAASASADPIPGPPLASARDRAGAFCPMPASVGGNAAGFAAGVLVAAIAGGRRDPRA